MNLYNAHGLMSSPGGPSKPNAMPPQPPQSPSPGKAAKEIAGYVKTSVADLKLWNISYEYENLLQLYKEQTALALAAKDRHVSNLQNLTFTK